LPVRSFARRFTGKKCPPNPRVDGFSAENAVQPAPEEPFTPVAFHFSFHFRKTEIGMGIAKERTMMTALILFLTASASMSLLILSGVVVGARRGIALSDEAAEGSMTLSSQASGATTRFQPAFNTNL
jgi:hypothetical protein